MKERVFKLKSEEIIQLITPMGGCIASDRITVDGLKVGFMFREETDRELDSGWRFTSDTENQEYMDDPNNWTVYDVNTIANCDRAIIPYLNLPVGVELERTGDTDEFTI